MKSLDAVLTHHDSNFFISQERCIGSAQQAKGLRTADGDQLHHEAIILIARPPRLCDLDNRSVRQTFRLRNLRRLHLKVPRVPQANEVDDCFHCMIIAATCGDQTGYSAELTCRYVETNAEKTQA